MKSMEIIDRNLESYYKLANYLKEEFNSRKYSFIKAVYIHGSFARGEITPKESDINLMVFTKKKELLKKEIEVLSKIKEKISKENNIKIEFKINNIEKNNFKNITTDMFYPYLYDFILNSFFIYGNRLEEDLLKILTSKNYFEFSFETTSVFSRIRIDFLESYFENNKYRMYHNLYKYARLLRQLKVNEKEVEERLLKIKDYNSIDKEIILNQILKFEEILEKTDLKKIYESNKKLKVILGYARGGLVYNTKTKKLLITEDDKASCSFWSYPKNLKDKVEGKDISKEIEESTGIKNITLLKKKIGECHNWFEKEENVFKKMHTEYYYATTDSLEETITKKGVNYKWIKVNEVKDYISSPCLGYIAKGFYEEVIKKL